MAGTAVCGGGSGAFSPNDGVCLCDSYVDPLAICSTVCMVNLPLMGLRTNEDGSVTVVSCCHGCYVAVFTDIKIDDIFLRCNINVKKRYK